MGPQAKAKDGINVNPTTRAIKNIKSYSRRYD
jgi:hypothetical protein